MSRETLAGIRMPDWKAYVRRHLPPLDIAPEREIEIVDELALQLEAAWESALARGLSDEEARRQAQAEVPDWQTFAARVARIERVRRRGNDPPRRRVASGGLLRGFVGDLAFAARSIVRARGYSALAILVLALGLGLGTAAFSVIDGVLLAPLPYPDAERLMVFHATVPPEGCENVELAYLDALDLAAESQTFSEVAAVLPFAGTSTIVDPPARVEGLEVSPRFFALLGVTPAIGRSLEPADGAPGARPVAVLGHAFWERLGAPADVVGRTIVLDEVPRTIVGVATHGFRFDLLAQPDDIFLPLTRDHPLARSRGIRTFRVVARLADRVSPEGANAVASTVGDRLQRSFPDTNKGRSFSVHPLQREIVGRVRPMLWLVGGLVALVLVLAAVNLASLQLTRAIGRARETALRLALGASRWRLIREAIAEGLVLTVAGAVSGLLIAAALLEAVRRAPGLVLPRIGEVALDWRAGGALVLMSGIVIAIAAFVPTSVMRTLHALSVLRTGHETADRTATQIRGALVSVQIGVAFVLLTTATLLGMSLQAVLSQPLGFETNHVASMRISVPAARYRTLDDTLAFYRDRLAAIRSRPQVSAAGLVSVLPLTGNTGSTLTIQGREDVPLAMRPTIGWQWASPGYFSAMGMSIVRGRDLADTDLQRLPHVTVINETLARLYFPGQDPIGQRVYFGGYNGPAPPEWHEVIGVVSDVRHRTLEAAPDARAYDLFGQHWGRTATLVIRTPDSPLQAAGLVRALVAERDPQLAVFAVHGMSEIVSGAVATRRLLLWLVTGFAAAGFFVVAVGLYATVAYVVARRTRELGVRLALGATSTDIRRLVLRYGLRIVTAGLGVGSLGALALKRAIDVQLFGVTSTNPAVLAGVAVGLVVTAMIACVIPAERALNADPAQSLRYE